MKEKELINISIESDIKAAVEEIFEQFGITKSEAVELFYRQIALTRDIPFVHRDLNKETIEAIEELQSKEGLTTYETFSELRQDLGV
ncbi:MAG: type II toxin-antitoxin system RelB/DinJ family antitoxin [Symploca sp. SIO2D2]|nr:type II toxin-antitoxin system RelB/DinJ family antitoxin [Symploca sp. SIO2D2]